MRLGVHAQPSSVLIYQVLDFLQVWPGEQYFFCDGKFVVAQKWMGCLGTLVMVLVPESLFLSLVVPKLDAPSSYVAGAMGYAIDFLRI